MKPSSSDDEPAVLPARLDRPLRGGLIGHGWAHPQIEQQIARARALAVESARSEGYAAGWSQGRRAATGAAVEHERRREAEVARQAEQAAARVEVLLAALADAVRRADAAAVPAWAEVSDAIVDGAVGIARAVLARELATVDATVLEALRTAVRCLGEPAEVTVVAHPADAALLAALTPAERPAVLRIRPDPALPPGTVSALTPAQRVTVDIPAALAAAQEVLRG
jgi:flagellar assembly protein FliH